jgi:hypothetical protein
MVYKQLQVNGTGAGISDSILSQWNQIKSVTVQLHFGFRFRVAQVELLLQFKNRFICPRQVGIIRKQWSCQKCCVKKY